MRQKISRRAFLAAAGLTAAAAALTACGASSSSTAASSEASSASSAASAASGEVNLTQIRDTVRCVETQEPDTFDPHKCTTLGAFVNGTVMESLVALTANSEPVPELCESFEYSDASSCITFRLRQGVKFHDGSTMTADDVVASCNRWIESYANARSVTGDARFEKVDDTTVKIQADHSILLLPTMMAGASQPCSITTAAACANEDENGFMQEIIGTGPYILAEIVHNQYIRVERFEDYTPYYLPDTTEEIADGAAGYKHAYTKNIYNYYVSEVSTHYAGLVSEEYDFANDVGPENLSLVEQDPTLVLSTFPCGILYGVFNKDPASICSDNNIRKAINAAANCTDMLIAVLGEDLIEPVSCYMTSNSGLWYNDAGSDQYDLCDPELAKSYLEEAGYNGETVRILSIPNNSINNAALVLQQNLQDAGMNCEVNCVDYATYLQLRADPANYDIFMALTLSIVAPNALPCLTPDYPGSTNDETLLDLMEEMSGAATMEEAASAWEEAQAYCWDYLPILNAGSCLGNRAYSAKLHGLTIDRDVRLCNIYMDL